MEHVEADLAMGRWLGAEDALRYGLVDEIWRPRGAGRAALIRAALIWAGRAGVIRAALIRAALIRAGVLWAGAAVRVRAGSLNPKFAVIVPSSGAPFDETPRL